VDAKRYNRFNPQQAIQGGTYGKTGERCSSGKMRIHRLPNLFAKILLNFLQTEALE
jgi:hypothetical protein